MISQQEGPPIDHTQDSALRSEAQQLPTAPLEPERPTRPRFTRREMITTFLKAFGVFSAVATGATAYFAVDRYLPLREKQLTDWEKSNVDVDTFIDQNKAWLKKTKLGCSLSPEDFGWRFRENAEPNAEDIEKIIPFLKELGITEVRFGLRWENCVDPNDPEKIDLSKYLPWLKALKKHGFKVCLNVGPIKTFRWPEEHVPDAVLNEVDKDLPPERGEVAVDSPLAKEALQYLNNLCLALKKEFKTDDESIIDFVTAFQVENEPFTQFGEKMWMSSEEYLTEAVKAVHLNFPTAKILINTPGTPVIPQQFFTYRKHFAFIRSLLRRFPSLDGAVISGMDYYFDTDNAFPFFSERTPDAEFSIEAVEGRNYIKNMIAELTAEGVTFESTETQFEPWEKHTLPGNSLQAAMFAILRSADFTTAKLENLKSSAKSLIRLWGVEYLCVLKLKGQFTEEHQKIVELIKKINAL